MRHRDSQTLFKEREERVRRRKAEKRAIREQRKEAQTMGSTIQTETEAEGSSEEDTSSEEEDDIETSRSVG